MKRINLLARIFIFITALGLINSNFFSNYPITGLFLLILLFTVLFTLDAIRNKG